MLNLNYLRSGYIMTTNKDSNRCLKTKTEELEKKIIKRREDYLNLSNSFRSIKTK